MKLSEYLRGPVTKNDPVIRAVNWIALFFLAALFLVRAARATVPSSTTWVQYTLTTNPQTLTVPFAFQNTPDVLVLDSKTSPPTVLTLNSDYSVSGGNGSTGSISTIVGGAHAVQVGDIITISRSVPLTQTTSFANGGPLTATMIGQAFDKVTEISQQLNLVGSNSLQFQGDEALSGVLPKSQRIGKYLAFDSNGVPVFLSGTGSVSQDVSLSLVTATGTPTARDLAVRFGEIVNVKDFGAVGDGTTNDTTAIAAALTATPAGGTIFFPRGTYVFSNLSVTKTVSFVGVGWFATSLQTAFGGSWSSAVSGTVLKSTATSGSAIASTGTTQIAISFKDLALVGPGSGTSTAVTYGSGSQAVSNANVDNVLVANFATGFSWANAYENKTSGVVFAGCSTGFYIGLNSNQNTFMQTSVWLSTVYGIQLYAAACNNFHGFVLEGCSGTAFRLGDTSQGNHLDSGYWEDSPATWGLDINGGSSGQNVITNSYFASSGDNVRVQGNTNKFLGLTVTGGNWTLSGGGNYVLGVINSTVTDTGSGNVIYDPYTQQYYSKGSNSVFQIQSGLTNGASGQAILGLNNASQSWSVRNAAGDYAVRDDTNGAYLFKINPGSISSATVEVDATSDTAPGGGGAFQISGGAYVSKGLYAKGFLATATSSPASGAAGVPGTITWDASYIYVCTASGVWKRAALTGGY